MADPAHLDRLIRRVAAQIRRRRAEHYGLRGAFYGALVAVLALLAKGAVGPLAPAAALGFFVLGAGAGVVLGLSLAVPRGDVARLADRAFGLEDRVATAIEWSDRADRSPLVDALLADAVSRVERLERGPAVRRVLPREARLLPLPLAAAVALALAPAVPFPAGRLPGFPSPAEEETTTERTGNLQSSDQFRPKPEAVRPTVLTERDTERASSTGIVRPADRPALFKDTALGGERPDFSSFLKKGDERLKLLEQVDALPDLQSDFTRSAYKMMAQQSKAVTAGLRPDQIPPPQIRDLLERMAQAGQKEGSEASQAASEGMRALDRGQQEKAIDAMNRALNALRQSDDQRKGALNLRGGKQGESGRRSSESGDSKEPGNPEQEEPGGSKGKLPGQGPGNQPKGEPTARLHAKGNDSSLEGDPRNGQKESIDTNMFGHAARVPSRLQYGGVFDQYQKMMEDAIAREQVPRDYQPQVKDYFRALGEK